MNTNLRNTHPLPWFVWICGHASLLRVEKNKAPTQWSRLGGTANSVFSVISVFSLDQAVAVAAAAFFERFTRERTVSEGLAPLETQ